MPPRPPPPVASVALRASLTDDDDGDSTSAEESSGRRGPAAARGPPPPVSTPALDVPDHNLMPIPTPLLTGTPVVVMSPAGPVTMLMTANNTLVPIPGPQAAGAPFGGAFPPAYSQGFRGGYSHAHALPGGGGSPPAGVSRGSRGLNSQPGGAAAAEPLPPPAPVADEGLEADDDEPAYPRPRPGGGKLGVAPASHVVARVGVRFLRGFFHLIFEPPSPPPPPPLFICLFCV